MSLGKIFIHLIEREFVKTDINTDGKYLLRRVVSNAVVMASFHPVIGPVFWSFYDNSDCNAPNQFGLSRDVDLAHRFKPGKVEYLWFKSNIAECNHKEMDLEEGRPGDENYCIYTTDVPSGDFAYLAQQASTTASAIYEWFKDAPWLEFPAPTNIGYRAEWTENPKEALLFFASELEDDDELDVQLAKNLGTFVPVTETLNFSSTPHQRRKVDSSINYALEADCAWTMHRLQNLWDGYQREHLICAFQYAGAAGRQHFAKAEFDFVSEHIQSFPELRRAWHVGWLLEKYFSEQANQPQIESIMELSAYQT